MNRNVMKRSLAVDIAKKKLSEAFNILCNTNYVLQHPKEEFTEMEIIKIFTQHVDAFLRKTFNNFDLKSEDEKEFFRVMELIRSIIAIMNIREEKLVCCKV